jgi:hypothetical protein
MERARRFPVRPLATPRLAMIEVLSQVSSVIAISSKQGAGANPARQY